MLVQHHNRTPLPADAFVVLATSVQLLSRVPAPTAVVLAAQTQRACTAICTFVLRSREESNGINNNSLVIYA